MIHNISGRLGGGIITFFLIILSLTACGDQATTTPISAEPSAAAPVLPTQGAPTATSIPGPTPSPTVIIFGTTGATPEAARSQTVIPVVSTIKVSSPGAIFTFGVPTPPLSPVPDGGIIPVYNAGAEIALTDNNRSNLRGLVSNLPVKQVAAYHSADRADKVKSFFDSEYKKIGWQNIALTNNPLLSSFAYFLTYQRNGQQVIIVLGDGETVGAFGIQGITPVETVIIVLTNFIPTNPAAGTPGPPRIGGGIAATTAATNPAGTSTTTAASAPTSASATTASATTAAQTTTNRGVTTAPGTPYGPGTPAPASPQGSTPKP